jgi:HJR/Mrr/RecB family endonuclease
VEGGLLYLSEAQLARLRIKQKKCTVCGSDFIPLKTSPSKVKCHHCYLKYIPSKKTPNLEEVAHKLLEKFDGLDGLDFEIALDYMFQELGYSVIRTKSSGDQGVDLVLEDKKAKIAIQTKRYAVSNYVSNTAVQEVLAGAIFYNCPEKWVITTSFFTSSAIQLARATNVILYDRNGLYEFSINCLRKNSKFLELIEERLN